MYNNRRRRSSRRENRDENRNARNETRDHRDQNRDAGNDSRQQPARDLPRLTLGNSYQKPRPSEDDLSSPELSPRRRYSNYSPPSPGPSRNPRAIGRSNQNSSRYPGGPSRNRGTNIQASHPPIGTTVTFTPAMMSRLPQAMANCPAGFMWVKIHGGYRCQGGSHWLSDREMEQYQQDPMFWGGRPPVGFRQQWW
ncbi:unnamed protein product [Periconia digitata]|uniref:Uncharacterized protein n=1 Tax=Periconia digitata TaxID=1303443 RepID=A0A9W4UFM2_9PLEO|nr:unnamed protein product [Periconia digitata]